MKVSITGNIAKARLNGIALVNAKAGDAVAVYIPRGLEFVYSEKWGQAKRGGGKMIDNHAALYGLTHKQSLDEITAEAETIGAIIENIESARQSAIVEINKALTVYEIYSTIEGIET